MDKRLWLCFHKALEDRFHSLCPVLLKQYGSLEEAGKDPLLRKNPYFTEDEKLKLARLDSFYEELPPFVEMIGMEDPAYPKRLVQYYLPPAVLYYIGDVTLLKKRLLQL